MMTLLVNLIAVFLIAVIIWWFWFSQSRASIANSTNPIEIKVKDGVYSPAIIQVQVDHPITLRFIREDASPCAESVIFNSLKISKHLPINEPTDLTMTVNTPGEYEFTCQMGMYRGKLIVSKLVN